MNWAAAALAGSGSLAGQVGRGQLCRGGACSRLDDGDDDDDSNSLFWMISDRPLRDFEVILSNMFLWSCFKSRTSELAHRKQMWIYRYKRSWHFSHRRERDFVNIPSYIIC